MQDVANAVSHLREHQDYPATKEELVEECDKLSDFSDDDKKWFMMHLPDGTYGSANDVIKALGLKEGNMKTM